MVKKTGKFRARIRFNGRNLSLGCFPHAGEAAHAHDEAARGLFHRPVLDFFLWWPPGWSNESWSPSKDLGPQHITLDFAIIISIMWKEI